MRNTQLTIAGDCGKLAIWSVTESSNKYESNLVSLHNIISGPVYLAQQHPLQKERFFVNSISDFYDFKLCDKQLVTMQTFSYNQISCSNICLSDTGEFIVSIDFSG